MLDFFDGRLTPIRLLNIDTCERCKKQFSRMCLSEETIFEDVMKNKPEVKEEIIEIIKNVMMLHKISDEDLKKEEEDTLSITPFNIPPSLNPPNIFPRKPYKPYPYKIPPYKIPPKPWKKWYSTTSKPKSKTKIVVKNVNTNSLK